MVGNNQDQTPEIVLPRKCQFCQKVGSEEYHRQDQKDYDNDDFSILDAPAVPPRTKTFPPLPVDGSLPAKFKSPEGTLRVLLPVKFCCWPDVKLIPIGSIFTMLII